MRWDGNCALAGVERRVRNSAEDRVGCLLEYCSKDLRIRGDTKTLTVRLTILRWFDFRIEFHIRKF